MIKRAGVFPAVRSGPVPADVAQQLGHVARSDESGLKQSFAFDAMLRALARALEHPSRALVWGLDVDGIQVQASNAEPKRGAWFWQAVVTGQACQPVRAQSRKCGKPANRVAVGRRHRQPAQAAWAHDQRDGAGLTKLINVHAVA